MDLSTRYMGLSMPNPVIVSASPLTANASSVAKVVEAGAGAVVLTSLFEEDIASNLDSQPASMGHPEAEAYVRKMGMLLEPDNYLSLVETCAARSDVPVIASLNCHSEEWWVDYAKRIEAVGADAIELNLSPMALDTRLDSNSIEDALVSMVRLARQEVKIPLAVKIGPNWSALPHLAHRLEKSGADALTLFNRYYKVDIDIENVGFKSGNSMSVKEEFGPVLRWIGILSDLTELDISASTGVYGAEEVIKTLLAGGNAAQMCSALLRQGTGHLTTVLEDLKNWMEEHGYSTISDFHSLLSLEDDQRNAFYQRLQYVKALKGKA